MTKYDIIKELAQSRFVESVIENVNHTPSPYDSDLAQDIYVELLRKNERLICELYEKNELRFFIVKMITNSLRSKTSPYYKKYEQFRKAAIEINEDKTQFIDI